jgi:hypothetical protein
MTKTKALWLAALLVLAVVAGSSAAFSYPSLQGPTGLVVLPDANVEPRGSWTLAADYVNVETEGRPASILIGPDLKLTQARLVWGVSDRAELWVAYTDINVGTPDVHPDYVFPDESGDNSHEWAGGAKLQIHDDPATGVKVAVGAGHYDASVCSSCHNIKRDNIYAVLTKESAARSPHQWRWKGSLGLTYTKFDFDGGEDTILQPFGGLEASSGRLSLVGEYRTKEAGIDDTGMWSAGARYMITPNLGLQAGVTNGAFYFYGIGAHKASAYYGLAYTFGGHRGKVEEAGY